jgi:hypothetical protein
MLKQVLKYPFQLLIDSNGVFVLELPREWKPVLVEMREGVATLWAEVPRDTVFSDLHSPTKPVQFKVFGTGHAIAPNFKHAGSWQDGSFVWHLYFYDS